jgi:hypothetical protein
MTRARCDLESLIRGPGYRSQDASDELLLVSIQPDGPNRRPWNGSCGIVVAHHDERWRRFPRGKRRDNLGRRSRLCEQRRRHEAADYQDGFKPHIDLDTGSADSVPQAHAFGETSAVLDGEFVTLGADGRPSFQALQNHAGRTGHAIVFYAVKWCRERGTECVWCRGVAIRVIGT